MEADATAKIIAEVIEEKRHSLREKQRRARQWDFSLEVAAIEDQLKILNDLQAGITERLTEG